VKSPFASELPQVTLTPVLEPKVWVSAKEKKNPICTETGAKSLVSMLKKPPTLHVVPMLCCCTPHKAFVSDNRKRYRLPGVVVLTVL